jgi:hypothetical protein
MSANLDPCRQCGNTNPEPPKGSVILDGDLDAWQRKWDGWKMVGGDEARTWSYIQNTYGVREVLHLAQVDA